MDIPVNTIGATGAVHDAERKHPEYGFILLWFVSHLASWWRV